MCVCVCVDVNECVQSPGVCSVGECVNTMGSYRCVCPSGYRSNSQQTSCQGDVYFLFVCLFVCCFTQTNVVIAASLPQTSTSASRIPAAAVAVTTRRAATGVSVALVTGSAATPAQVKPRGEPESEQTAGLFLEKSF